MHAVARAAAGPTSAALRTENETECLIHLVGVELGVAVLLILVGGAAEVVQLLRNGRNHDFLVLHMRAASGGDPVAALGRKVKRALVRAGVLGRGEAGTARGVGG